MIFALVKLSSETFLSAILVTNERAEFKACIAQRLKTAQIFDLIWELLISARLSFSLASENRRQVRCFRHFFFKRREPLKRIL